MANTENIEAKLCAYVDGELDPAGRAEIEAHLAAHPQHQQLMAELMRQRELLAALPRERAPEDLFEAMTNQLERSVLLDGDAAAGAGAAGAGGAGGTHAARRINPWPQVFAAAAVLALAIGLAAVIYFVLPDPSQRSQYSVVNTGTTAPSGAVASVAAPSVGGAAAPPGEVAVAPETRPTAIARRDVEAKAGVNADAAAVLPEGGMADGVAAGRSAAAATSAPAAVAVAPTPAQPSVVPAAPAAAAPQDDVFSKAAEGPDAGATALGKAGGTGVSTDALTNVFADSLLNEKLEAAPGVPDNSMLVVVSSDNPSATNQQIQEYFANNNIRWQPVTEPMPNLELRENQTMIRSRLADTRMSLKGGGEPSAAPPAAVPGSTSGEAREQRQQELARTETDAAKPSRDANTDDALSGARQTAVPPATDAQTEPGVALQGGDRAPGGFAGAAAPLQQSATSRPTAEDATDHFAENESAAQDPAQPRQMPADEVSLAPAAPQVQQQQQQQQQASPEGSQQQPQSPLLQQQAGQQSPGRAIGQEQFGAVGPAWAQPQSQLFIARGLTRQQVSAMNSALASGNRISNYTRAGDTITPATLPAVPDLALHSLPASQAAAGTNQTDVAQGYARGSDAAAPATTPAGDDRVRDPSLTVTTSGSDPREGTSGAGSGVAARAGIAAPSPVTVDGSGAFTAGPATTRATQPAGQGDADDRVDVVILVQPETRAGVQVLEQVTPSAAPGDAPAAPEELPTTTAPAATEPVLAPAPAERLDDQF